MRASAIMSTALLYLVAGVPVRAAAPPPPLQAEQLSVQKLPPRSPHWVYVFDEAFFNEIDARIHLFDGDTYRRLGQIDAGFTPGVNLSPDGMTTVVATTYFARGSRGTRTDVVEFTDNAHAAGHPRDRAAGQARRDHPEPVQRGLQRRRPLRLRGLRHPGRLLRRTRSGTRHGARGDRYRRLRAGDPLRTQPRVIAVRERAPAHRDPRCAGPRELARTMSEPFFDTDQRSGVRPGHPGRERLRVPVLPRRGARSRPRAARSRHFAPPLVAGDARRRRGDWRPGGVQVGAMQRALGRLYVPMHEGGEGSHKEGGTRDLGVRRRQPPPPGALAGGAARAGAGPRRAGIAGCGPAAVRAPPRQADVAVLDALHRAAAACREAPRPDAVDDAEP